MTLKRTATEIRANYLDNPNYTTALAILDICDAVADLQAWREECVAKLPVIGKLIAERDDYWQRLGTRVSRITELEAELAATHKKYQEQLETQNATIRLIQRYRI